ncbi:uncharacterized protein LOC141884418 [Acropora palmata]|uniref:uncharacterized protein LOC141884418 n=1 Tax=Acropora palmata TaxID=6131 RepID=UPI003DA0AB47
MASWMYKPQSQNNLVNEFKSKASSFKGSVQRLEDRAKKCKSLKWLDEESPNKFLSKGNDDKYFLDWQPYLNDGKRKLSRSLEKLKEIQNHRKQRKVSFIGSLKEALPSWAKTKIQGTFIQLHQLICDTEDYEALISDIVEQITTADELTKMVNKISNQRDPNQNEQISKEQKDLTKRWNTLSVTVITRSNGLESLGNQVDHMYKKLNEWYKNCDSFRLWLNSREKKLYEVSSGSEDSLSKKKETLTIVQGQIEEIKNHNIDLQDLNNEAELLLNSGRLDQGDAERVGKMNELLSARCTALKHKLADIQSKLFLEIQELTEKLEKKNDEYVMEVLAEPDKKPPRLVVTPFDTDQDESNKRDLERSNSMKGVKKMLNQFNSRTISAEQKNRIDGESVKAFDSSLDTCEKVLNEIDDELMEKFSYVGSTINEIKKQLDDIQVLEQRMTKEDDKFAAIKVTFEESESKDLIKEENRRRLRRKVDDLTSRLAEMWRNHDVSKDRLVQAILIMGEEWMGRVNDSLDDLEKEIQSIEIPEGDLEALREEESRHSEIMNQIMSREDSVSSAVDVAREVHRRNLVTEETGKNIENNTQSLEDRLERLINKAEEKKKRISEEITKVEQTRVVNETMMASSVVTVHTAPDQSQADEGFYEPKQSQPNEKETYESIMRRKMKELKKKSKAMNEWMDETEKLVNSLRVDMDARKASRIQQKINTYQAQVDEKESIVEQIVIMSKEIENENIDPNVSDPFVKIAVAVKERWSKNKEMLENHGDDDLGSKASEDSCCVLFLKRKFFPAWSST